MIAASVVLHIGYRLFLINAYKPAISRRPIRWRAAPRRC